MESDIDENEEKMFIRYLDMIGSNIVKQKNQNEANADAFWDSLSEEDKINAFHSVTKRIVKAELEDQGSYRHALYTVFGFGAESYGVGIDCGYLHLHNSLFNDRMRRDIIRAVMDVYDENYSKEEFKEELEHTIMMEL